MATPLRWIENLSDPALEPYRELPRTNLTRWSGLFVVEGRTLVERLVASRYPVASVLVGERYVEQLPTGLSPDVPVYVVAHHDIDRLIGFKFHRGMLACGHRLPDLGLPALAERCGAQSLWCICPRILDPTNLGSIIRNAAALGAHAVILGPQSADPFSRRCLRVSMGTALRLPIRQVPELADGLLWLQDCLRLELIATVLDPTAEHLSQASRAAHVGLVFGAEGGGLEDEWLRLCSRRITLPMAWQTDSLNVASATAVFLYHFTNLAQLPRRVD